MLPHLRTVGDLSQHLSAHGALPVHARGIIRDWLQGRIIDQSPMSPGFRRSRELESALPGLRGFLDGILRESLRVVGGDGSCRRLFRLQSARTIETIDLPRHGLCVSTQVGCAVGCIFCKTGEGGLIQHLSPLEILAQVAAVRRERPVQRVVFMGLGEPMHNLGAVLEAIAALGEEGGIGHKNLVFSTVGEGRLFERLLARRIRPALALSLHTLREDRRAWLLPRAPRIDPTLLLDLALDYADRTTYPLLVQWTLLEGTNDSFEEANRLADRLIGRRAMVNYIPCNSVEGKMLQRPPVARCVALVRAVKARGVRATLRFSAAQDIQGGCGQLRSRTEPGTSEPPQASKALPG